MSGDLTPTELRVKVAEAMGYASFREDGDILYGKKRIPEDWQRVPNFGAPEWSATGAVLDEIKRRGWGCYTSAFRSHVSSSHDCMITTDNDAIEATDPCRHRAICLAFLEAHARAKEPNDAR